MPDVIPNDTRFDECWEEKFDVIDPSRTVAVSDWGHSWLEITLDQIQALQDGKILFYDDGEYTTLVRLKRDIESPDVPA